MSVSFALHEVQLVQDRGEILPRLIRLAQCQAILAIVGSLGIALGLRMMYDSS